MYKQTFTSPLTRKTLKLSCGHNAFAHHVFPRVVHAHGLTLLEELEASPQSANNLLVRVFTLINETYPADDTRPTLQLRDISITLESVNEHPLAILTLTEPEETTGAYLIGLLTQQPKTSGASPTIRYFTLERTYDRSTALCEWDAELTHRFISNGPKPSPRAFAQAIEELTRAGHV